MHFPNNYYIISKSVDKIKDGRLAQLVEHLLDVQGVRDSSSLPSTRGAVRAIAWAVLFLPFFNFHFSGYHNIFDFFSRFSTNMTIYRIVNLWYTKGAIKINRFPTERPPFPAGVLLFPAAPPKTPPPGLEKSTAAEKSPAASGSRAFMIVRFRSSTSSCPRRGSPQNPSGSRPPRCRCWSCPAPGG